MMTSAMPSRRDRSFISSRICAWMVTSSAVVGSSAMISLGLQASPIAIITRWRMPPDRLMRILLEPAARGSVMPTSRSSSTARARACVLAHPEWMSSGSMICRPIGSTGLSEVIGSWKIIAMSRPRSSRISSSDRSSRSRPSNRMRPARYPAGLLGEQAHDGERRHRLAGAGFADDGDDLAAVDGVRNAVDRADHAARGLELDVQVLHLQQRCIRSLVRTVLRQRSPWPCGRRFSCL